MKLFSIFFQKNRISYRFEFILSNILSKLLLIDVTVGLRMSKEDETLGADMTEHGIYDPTDTLVFGNKESVRVRRKISSIRKDTKDTNSRSYSKKGAINFGIVSIKKESQMRILRMNTAMVVLKTILRELGKCYWKIVL